MAVKLPRHVSKLIKERVFSAADDFEYDTRSRVENGRFLNQLAANPEIGGILSDYMEESAVRTYIKDGVLNAYSKRLIRKKLNQITNSQVVQAVYGETADVVGQIQATSILRSNNSDVFLLQSGTVLKWETALRKLLECVVANPQISNTARSVKLCLVLVVHNGEMSFGDQTQIESALDYIGVKVFFVK